MRERLQERGVPSVVYYPLPLTKQAGYADFPTVSGGTPVSEELAETVLSLPMHPYLKASEQEKIISAVNSVVINY